MELRAGALRALLETDPATKAAAVFALAQTCRAGGARVDIDAVIDEPPSIPGRPAKPELVPPLQVGRRSMGTPEGRAMLVHALAHIEFNAVNLALDALWRFPGMPEQYYLDWLRVADEEALHFTMLSEHLGTLGYAYGDFPGHDSLWEMVAKTSGDVLARMALILDRLLVDEVGHVEIGNRWYLHLCLQRALEPIATYDELTVQYKAPVLKGPFNIEGRRQAGFSEAELQRYR